MAGRSRVPRALKSVLGHITGHTRRDIANPYVLRVAHRAWGDIGETPPAAAKLEAVAGNHGIVWKFYDQYSEPGRVDKGVPIAAVADKKVFRIRREEWRAACRYTPEDGTQWLCRALSLASFNDEAHAYEQFGALEAHDALLPDEAERRQARSDQFVLAAALALREALIAAEGQLTTWWDGEVLRPGGGDFRAGRAYVEHDPIDDEGTIVVRYLLIVRVPPPDVTPMPNWQAFVAGIASPVGEDFSSPTPGCLQEPICAMTSFLSSRKSSSRPS